VIQRAKDLRIQKAEHLVGGKGTVDIVHFLEKEEACGTGRLFSKNIIPKGASIGYHPHNGEFEIYYILSGTARVSDNGKEEILYPGDAMFNPNGNSHSIENIGDEDLEFIAIILYVR